MSRVRRTLWLLGGLTVVAVLFAAEFYALFLILHAGRKEFTLRQTIQSVLLKLPPRKFAQIHRSHAVNLSRVSEVVKLGKGDAEVVLTSGKELRLSRRFRSRLRDSFGWPL